MKEFFKFLKPLTGLIVIIILAWYFSSLFLYFLFAAALSLLGTPLKKLLKKIHIKKYYVGNTLATIVTICVMLLFVCGFILFIVPLVRNQALMLSNIDTGGITLYLNAHLAPVHDFLIENGVLNLEQSLLSMFEQPLDEILNLAYFSTFFEQVISTTSSVFMAFFVIIFLTFFFLKDPAILRNIIMALTPEKYVKQMEVVLFDTRYLLTRYFIGISFELICMMTIISIILTIFGVRNPIIIGFLGGLMNVIPYLGPIIGAVIGVLLAVISVLSESAYDSVFSTMLIVICTFIFANLIDNFLLQPLIYSKSVKAHPVEIFLVIIMAGQLAGIAGMILAIPVYTVFRVAAKQFLTKFKFIDELTKNIELDEIVDENELSE